MPLRGILYAVNAVFLGNRVARLGESIGVD